MILGGSTMQIPSIKIAKKMGWRVIVADGNPQVEGRIYADHFAHIDLKDKTGMEKAARHYHELFGLQGVFTAGTDFSTTVAYIAEKLELPGIPYEVACNATNKSQMRNLFKIHAVPCPDFVTLFPGDSPEKVLKNLSFPVVVKPVDNMGARGVRRVDSRNELYDAVHVAQKASMINTVIVEEFLQGPELSLDAIIYNGQITICGIADRHIFFPPYFVEMGHTMPTALPDDCIKQVIDVFCKGIKALGITNGAAKGDIIVTKQGPKVGEIAARLSGGYMSGWTFPYSSGIEVTEAALQIAVGQSPGDLTSRVHMVSAERAFISIPGIIRTIINFENVKTMRNIQATFIRVKKGMSVVFPRNNVEKCGNIISRAQTREEAVSSSLEAIKQIIIRLEPDNEVTDTFLFNRSREDWLNNITAFPANDPFMKKTLDQSPFISGNMNITDPEKISIDPSPFYESHVKDWHGTLIKEALECVCSLTGLSFYTGKEKDHLVLGKIFWQPFLKGGSQGGLYILDSVFKALKEGTGIVRRLERWIS
ncbi:MAG: ATP-grasp domain-containing protein [Spirochaetales bacterium]|nr:ATP-grasp domain-containing protein [Spirochaetales bacterium]